MRRHASAVDPPRVLLDAGLQQVYEPLLVYRLQRRDRRAGLGANAWDLTAEEQANARRRPELTHSPGASDIIRDASNDDAPEPVPVRAACAHDAQRRSKTGVRWCSH